MYPEISLEIGREIILIKSYHLFMILSIGVGTLLAALKLKHWLKPWLMILIGLIVSFVLGARLLNFIINPNFYIENNLSIFTLKTIGFSFYGGIIGSLIFLFFSQRILKFNLFQLTDTLILPFGISFFIMRIGCFLNGCCYGKISHDIGITMPAKLYNPSMRMFAQLIKIHPTQLYEGGLAILGVLFFAFYRKKLKVPGQLTIYYGIYLTCLRWFVLYFRHLEYSKWIIYYFYPLLYASFIIIGILASKFLKTNGYHSYEYLENINTHEN